MSFVQSAVKKELTVHNMVLRGIHLILYIFRTVEASNPCSHFHCKFWWNTLLQRTTRRWELSTRLCLNKESVLGCQLAPYDSAFYLRVLAVERVACLYFLASICCLLVHALHNLVWHYRLLCQSGGFWNLQRFLLYTSNFCLAWVPVDKISLSNGSHERFFIPSASCIAVRIFTRLCMPVVFFFR